MKAWVAGFLIVSCVACAEEFAGPAPLDDGVHYPIALAVDQEHDLLFVANSNFNLAYRSASVVTLDLRTNEIAGPYVAMGSFPGDFILVESASGEGRFGYIAVRGNNSLTWFSVADKDGAPAGAEPGDSVELSCADEGDPQETCSGDHVVTNGEIPTGDADEGTEEAAVGASPYGLAFLPGDGERPDRLALAAMEGGRLSLFDIVKGGRPVMVAQAVVSTSMHSLAVDPKSGNIFATSKTAGVVYRYAVREEGTAVELDKLSTVALPSPYSSVYFGRGLAFAHGGDYMLVAYRNPAGLLVVHPTEEESRDDQNAVAMIPLGSKPANVRVFKSGLGGKEMAYLMGYGDDRVWVVDLDTLQPVAEIPVGAGPYDMTAALGEGSARRGYVSCFLGHRVAVIDLDPASPYYHTRIAEIH